MKHLLSAPLEFLHDFHGGKSSKRFWGNRSATIGSYMLILLFLASFIFGMIFGKTIPQESFDNCYKVGMSFLCTGFGVLGLGVVEYFGKKK
jgi:hypothetical protein